MYIAFGIIASFIYFTLLKRENARRDKGERDETIGDGYNDRNEKNGRYATVEDAKKDKGDNWSGYRYCL